MHTASTETLFRFVTMRKPEKATKKFKDERIISWWDFNGGVFGQLITSPKGTIDEQLALFNTLVTDMSYSPTTIAFFEGNFPDFYRFSLWLAENGQDVAEGLIEIDNQLLNNTYVNFEEIRSSSWDSLIYYCFTGKSPSNMQQMVNMLVAIHYLTARNNVGEEAAKPFAIATVTLPHQLFAIQSELPALPVKDTKKRTPTLHYALTQDYRAQKKSRTNINTLNALVALREGISDIHNKYNKENNIAYNDAYTQYEQELKNAFAASTSSFNNETLRREYTNLNLPEFNYTPLSTELNEDTLNSLSESNQELCKSLGIYSGNTKFVDAYERIDKQIANLRVALSSPTTSTSNTALRLQANNSQMLQFDVEISCLSILNNEPFFYIAFSLNTGDSSIYITHANCTLSTGVSFSNYPNQRTTNTYRATDNSPNGYGGVVKAIDFFMSPVNRFQYEPKIPFSEINGKYCKIEGEITLSNGKVYKYKAESTIGDGPIAVDSTTVFSYEGMLFLDSDSGGGNGGGTGGGGGNSEANCLPTNIKAVSFKNGNGKYVYYISYTKPVNPINYLRLFYRVTGATDWIGGNIDYVPDGQLRIELDNANYEFKLAMKAEGDCDKKETQNFVATEDNQIGDDIDHSPSGIYIPNQYGIKNLGIGEFRRLEQTFCCYEPGEVASIENIMQGEYREKSSKRLRRTEETTTTETKVEKELLTDTTTAERYSMQNQVSQVLSQSTSASAYANFSIGQKANVGSNLGFNSNKQESNNQAVNYAKDVTVRALERVVKNVREEQIIKVTEEFEEKNMHGYDNRGGTDHVAGVYRFIDKIYKNQIVNYGKRLMYEFAIPQPSQMHLKAVKAKGAVNNAGIALAKPIHPADAELHNRVLTYAQLDAQKAAYWASVFGVEIEAEPLEYTTVGKSLSIDAPIIDKRWWEKSSGKDELRLPEGYAANSAKVNLNGADDGDGIKFISVNVGNKTCLSSIWQANGTKVDLTKEETFIDVFPFTESFPISYTNLNCYCGSINVSVTCKRTEEHYTNWQIKAYTSIIEAYNKKTEEYNNSLANTFKQQLGGVTNPLFFRQIEQTSLKKNCMDYLASANTVGQPFYTGNSIDTVRVSANKEMQAYSNLIKFLEEAFDWDLISYKFYPFYWAKKNDWQNLYEQEVDDALFKSFLQAGMATVIVPVREGFNKAVMHYMATGQLLQGTTNLLIDLDLYKDIDYEVANQEYPILKTWTSRVPSTLTMLQKGSSGLARPVNGLPCFCEEPQTSQFTGSDDINLEGKPNTP